MQVFQKSYKGSDLPPQSLGFDPAIILLFISPLYDNPQAFVDSIHKTFPNATITGCSTSGEIENVSVLDESIVLNAISFDKTTHKLAEVTLDSVANSYDAGLAITESLNSSDLRHILVFSDGLNVNGAELVKGISQNIEKGVSVTGGLAGDGPDFNQTFTINQNILSDGKIIGIGLYGSELKIGYGSKGGWDSFGIERLVTKSKENVLYELDGKPALALYKSFLGEKAKDLPGSGLLFPLNMRIGENQLPVVRTILAVDEATQSLTFAGNIPEGAYVRLMKANIDRLIDGAEQSAEDTLKVLDTKSEFALLISCVGRRLVLKQMVEEEVEAVRSILGDTTTIAGFYSYGELAPFGKYSPCKLHNQTMTITTFSE